MLDGRESFGEANSHRREELYMPTGVDGTASDLIGGVYPAPALRFSAAGYPPSGSLPFAERVRYAVMAGSPVIEFEPGRRSATEVYMMNSTSLATFANMSLGLSVPWTDAPFLMRNRRSMPGNPDLLTARITARPMEDRPADPFVTDNLTTFDANQYAQTYSRFMLVTIEYSSDWVNDAVRSTPRTNVCKGKPETYTTQKNAIGGEFLNIPGQGCKWATVNKKAFGPPNTRNQGTGFSFINIPVNAAQQFDEDELTNADAIKYVPFGRRVAANGTDIETGAVMTEHVADAGISFPRVIAIREWTITWRHVFSVPWMTINRMLGKVNGTRMNIFQRAPEEAVLFTGGTISEEPLKAWDGRALYTVEYHFIEKTLWELYDSEKYYAVLGWNHFWRPKANANGGEFQRLIVNATTGEGPYRTGDFLKLFERDKFFSKKCGLGAFAFEAHPGPGQASALAKSIRETPERPNGGLEPIYEMP